MGFGGDDGLKLLVYGRSASGKTSFWSTFPDKILACVCSGASNPGELRSIDTAENNGRIDQIEITSSEDLRVVIDHVRKTKGYKTVVLDHVTGLQDKVLAEILGLEQLPEQKSYGMAERQHYGQCSAQTKELLRLLMDLSDQIGANVVLVAQDRKPFEGDTGDGSRIAPVIGAQVQPALANWLYPAMDYIVCTFIRPKVNVRKVTSGSGKSLTVTEIVEPTKGVEFCMLVAPDPLYITKFRTPRRDIDMGVIVNPDYDQLISLIRGS